LKNVLEEARVQDEDFVFCTSLGTPLGHRNLARRGLEPALEAAGLDRMTWQDLRHLAACVLIAESDGDADHVSRVLGRSSAAITQAIYAHEFEKVTRADRLRDRMEAAYGAMLGGKQSLPARP
jgi:integrase